MFFHENHSKLEMKRTKEKPQNPSKFHEKWIVYYEWNYTLARLWKQLAHLLALALKKQVLKIPIEV